MTRRENAKTCNFINTCIPLNALSANLLMELYEKSSFVIGKLDDANVYDCPLSIHANTRRIVRNDAAKMCT